MSSRLLFDFTPPAKSLAADWSSVDDPVMGGVSESRFAATDEGAAFTGTVSLAHGGGFASVRAPELNDDLSKYEGLRLRLRGDGRRYWVTMYTVQGGSVSYRAPLRPAEQWTTTEVRFDALKPYRRGRNVPSAPPFDAAQLRTLGFLIADEQEGPFRLEVAWIRAGLESKTP